MKNLVREIHRRSLWQVLGIYLAVSWIALQVDGNGQRWLEGAWSRAAVIERLGALYDEADDAENATRYYAMFADLWAEADPELQPRVGAARARLAELRG